jgi:hypothetical protein
MDGDARSASDDARKVASGQPHLLHPEPDGIDWVWRIDFESVEYPWIFYAPILGSRTPPPPRFARRGAWPMAWRLRGARLPDESICPQAF